MTATLGEFGESSSGESVRPIRGLAPSIENRLPDALTAPTRSAPVPRSRLCCCEWKAAISENDEVMARQSRKSAADTGPRLSPRFKLLLQIKTRRFGFWYGSGWSKTELTIPKIAVVPPIPSPRVTRVAAVRAGFLRNLRAA